MTLWFLLIGLVGLISACAEQDGVNKVLFNGKIVTLDRSYYGLQTMPRGPYIAIVRGLNERGWRVGTHAVGDAAIDSRARSLRASEDESIVDERWAIEHGFIPRAEHFARMRALGLHVAAQHHLYLAAPSLIKNWGQERAEWVTPDSR